MKEQSGKMQLGQESSEVGKDEGGFRARGREAIRRGQCSMEGQLELSYTRIFVY